jgi:NADH-quinone oxidoreductase subunit G
VMKVAVGSSVYDLEISLRSDVPRGVSLIPAGIPPIDGISLPAQGKLIQAAAVQGVTTQ